MPFCLRIVLIWTYSTATPQILQVPLMFNSIKYYLHKAFNKYHRHKAGLEKYVYFGFKYINVFINIIHINEQVRGDVGKENMRKGRWEDCLIVNLCPFI